MSKLFHFYPIGEAISLLFHPHIEVVIHDLNSGCIAAIYNNFSKRKVGDESLLEEFKELPDISSVYLKTSWDGKKIKSISVTLKDENKKAIGLLCVNLDLSKFEESFAFLKGWLENAVEQPAVLFKDDWREKINAYVSEYLIQEKTTMKLLEKEKKRVLVIALHKEGAFKAKNAASYVADVLDLSRATVYNYLKGEVHE